MRMDREMLFKCIDCGHLFSMEVSTIESPKGDIVHVHLVRTHERIETFDCDKCLPAKLGLEERGK